MLLFLQSLSEHEVQDTLPTANISPIRASYARHFLESETNYLPPSTSISEPSRAVPKMTFASLNLDENGVDSDNISDFPLEPKSNEPSPTRSPAVKRTPAQSNSASKRRRIDSEPHPNEVAPAPVKRAVSVLQRMLNKDD